MRIKGRKIEIGPETLLQRNNELLFNDINGEIVMLSIENGEYYGMNKIGSAIWKLIEKPIRYEVLIEQLLLSFNISKEICLADTSIFLKDLFHKKLIAFS
jgi:hypothetical protein